MWECGKARVETQNSDPSATYQNHTERLSRSEQVGYIHKTPEKIRTLRPCTHQGTVRLWRVSTGDVGGIQGNLQELGHVCCLWLAGHVVPG